MSLFVRVSSSTAIMQYIFFALFAQRGGGEVELKSIVQVCAAVALTSHTLWCQKLLSYICVIVSTGSSLHQPAVMLSAAKGRIFFFFLTFIHSQQSNYNI